jgi:hypothetical protein
MDFPSPIMDIVTILIEATLGLSGSLNNMVIASNETKIFIRIMLFLGIALFTANKKDILSVCNFSAENLFRFVFLGLLSFLTTYLTQNGLKELPVETNLLIQKSFPLISTVIGYNILNNHQPFEYVPLFVFAYALMIFVLRPKPHHLKKIKKFNSEQKQRKYKAFIGLIISAVISCILYLIFRLKIESHETGIIRMNLGAFVVMIGYFIMSKQFPDVNFTNWAKLIAIYVGFGYTLGKIRTNISDSIPEIHYAICVFLGTCIAFLIAEIYPIFQRKASEDFEKHPHKQKA